MTKESFWSRWSRRKQAAHAVRFRTDEERAKSAVTDVVPSQSERSDDEAALPEVKQLDGNSDFTAFMSEGVEPLLQRAALRKLWAIEPRLAELDGLVDYGEDYTAAAAVAPALRHLAGAASTLQPTRSTADARPTGSPSANQDPSGDDSPDKHQPSDRMKNVT